MTRLLRRASNDVPAPSALVNVRDPSVDALRGIAICAMVAANMAAHCLEQPHPWPLRAYGSLAAPTFIFLAGMVGGDSSVPFLRGLRRAGWRLLVLWAWAVSIDVFIWGISPFETFDVLYVIGLALPVAELCRALDLRLHALAAAAFVLLTPLVQLRHGYRFAFSEGGSGLVAWQRLFIDGWFPLFPWLGVALCGALFGRLRRTGSRWAQPRASLVLAAALLATGALVWVRQRPPFPTRAGYSEFLYPPSLALVGASLGCLLALLAALSAWQGKFALRWLVVQGRASLLLYVVHCLVIAFVLKRFFRDLPLREFLLVYAVHLVLLSLIARSAQALARQRAALFAALKGRNRRRLRVGS